MAIELITGKAGTPHISSADVGAFNAGLFGAGNYILNGCNCTINSATSINVSAGEALCEGRHWRITGAGENLTIQNGASGYKRNDIVAAHYTRNGSGVEAVTLVVIKGTPSTGAQADPAMPNTGKVLEGASDAYWPLYRVTLNGLTPQTPEMLADSNPLITVGSIGADPEAARTLLQLGALATKSTLDASDVPNLNASKITAGTLPITRGGTGATTAAGILTNLSITDKVEASGTSGNWLYLKFSSGLAILYRYGTVAPSWVAWGDLWNAKVLSANNYPFTFTGAPAINLRLEATSGFPEIAGNASKSQCPDLYWASAGSKPSNTSSVGYGVMVVGRWK